MKRVPKTTCTLRLSENAREILRRAAEAEVRSLSQMAEIAIREHLARYAAPAASKAPQAN